PLPAAAQASTLVDLTPPTSSVKVLPAATATLQIPLQWSGQDGPNGSGIASYNIYASDNGGPYTSFLLATTQTSASFAGVFGHTYRFYSVATDKAGNREATSTTAQA